MKKISLVLFVFCLVSLALTGCQVKASEVCLQLAEATNAQDLKAALALFADDAVVTSVSPEPFRGKAQIQGWLEGMFADNFEIEAEIVKEEGTTVIEKDTVSMDSMRFYGIEKLTGTSEVTVIDGLITAITFRFSEETLADLASAPFVAREDLIGVWTVGTFIQFNEDGTGRIADKVADLSQPVDDNHPGSLEKWSYDGMVITFQVVENNFDLITPCTSDMIGIFFVKWAGDNLDRLKFEAINDPCVARLAGMQYGNWAPVTP